MTSGAARHDLYTALRDAIGDQNADTLMTYLPPVRGEGVPHRAEVAGMRADLTAFRSEVVVEFAAVRGEMKDEFRSFRLEFDGKLDTLRAEIRTDLATFRREMAARFDSVDKRFDRAFIAQIASTVALFTAILAVAG